MKELLTKARQYAEGALKDCLTDALAKAFVDGYNAGIEDKEATQKVVVEGEVEYVDLGLPSGTLWTSDFLKEGESYKYLCYDEAKDLPLPTPEQWKELVRYCRIGHVNDNKKGDTISGKRCQTNIVGPNGNSIVLKSTGYFGNLSKKEKLLGAHFWLTGEGKIAHEMNCKHIGFLDKTFRPYDDRFIDASFLGYKLCVRLVKSK